MEKVTYKISNILKTLKKTRENERKSINKRKQLIKLLLTKSNFRKTIKKNKNNNYKKGKEENREIIKR